MDITSLLYSTASNGATRQRQNATAPPIAQLPTELLAEIIGLTLPTVKFALGELEFHAFVHVRRLYTVRFVAKRWQEIIDATPTFWTFVVSTLPPHVNETTIQRSKIGPLVVVYASQASHGGYSDTWPSFEDFFGSLAHTFPRWSAYSGPLVSEYFDKPVPHLRQIILTSTTWSTTPLELFGGSPTNLRYVHLSNLSIRWKTGLFTKLNVLKLNNAVIKELTTTQLFDILHASPCLEHLEFERMLATVDQPASPQAITLPNLRYVYVRACGDDLTAAVLQQIRAPSCIEFVLDVNLNGPEPDVVKFLNEDLHYFQELLGVAHRRNGSSEITIDDNHFIWASSGRGDVQDPLLFRVSIRCHDPGVCIRWAEIIIQDNPTVCIRFAARSYVFEPVLDAIAPMRSVTRMELKDVWSIVDLHLALELIGKPLSTNPSLPSLPCLRELFLCDVKWTSQNLLKMVHSRFNSLSWEDSERTPLTISIPRESFAPDGRSRPILDLTTLTKIRGIEGVEQVRLVGSEELDGMVAITWDERTSEPARG